MPETLPRSFLNDRSRIAVNRPEGPPHWFDAVYETDPSLSPDQQMLPTHAKRMMKEKMEKEGKFGSAQDQNYTPTTPLDFVCFRSLGPHCTRPHPLPETTPMSEENDEGKNGERGKAQLSPRSKLHPSFDTKGFRVGTHPIPTLEHSTSQPILHKTLSGFENHKHKRAMTRPHVGFADHVEVIPEAKRRKQQIYFRTALMI